MKLAMLGLFTLNVSLLAPACCGQTSESGTQPSTNNVSPSASGPQALKQRVRVTVETNAPVLAPVKNEAAPKQKSFNWKFSWEGWNGLHSELSQKTLLNDPLAEVRERIQGTNAYRVFHLEQFQMSGKIGAKLALDGAAYATGKGFEGFDAGAELRRARIYAKGDCLLVLPVSYQLEIG